MNAKTPGNSMPHPSPDLESPFLDQELHFEEGACANTVFTPSGLAESPFLQALSNAEATGSARVDESSDSLLEQFEESEGLEEIEEIEEIEAYADDESQPQGELPATDASPLPQVAAQFEPPGQTIYVEIPLGKDSRCGVDEHFDGDAGE